MTDVPLAVSAEVELLLSLVKTQGLNKNGRQDCVLYMVLWHSLPAVHTAVHALSFGGDLWVQQHCMGCCRHEQQQHRCSTAKVEADGGRDYQAAHPATALSKAGCRDKHSNSENNSCVKPRCTICSGAECALHSNSSDRRCTFQRVRSFACPLISEQILCSYAVPVECVHLRIVLYRLGQGFDIARHKYTVPAVMAMDKVASHLCLRS